MSDENLLSMAAFREGTGASEATVSRWLKRGLPCVRIARQGGGRAQVFFDKIEALGWAAKHGSLTTRRKALALAGSIPAAAPDQTPGTDAEGKPSTAELPGADEGLLAALDRLKKQELASHRLLLRLKERGDLNAVLAVAETHLAETKALAVLENAAVQYRVRIGELGPRAEMQSVFERVIVSVKNAVLGIPSNVIPQLIPYLRDPEQVHGVHDILDRAARDALRAASERHTRPKLDQPPPRPA